MSGSLFPAPHAAEPGRGRAGIPLITSRDYSVFTAPSAYLALTLLMSMGLLSACGYQLSGQSKAVSGSMQRISVPMFANTTTVPGLEQQLTAAVRTQLQRDGRARLGTEANSTARMRGTVTDYQLQLLANTRGDFALEYRILVNVHVWVEDLQQRQTILDQTLAVTTDYVVSSEIVPTEIARERALQALARDTGERVVSLLLDRF